MNRNIEKISDVIETLIENGYAVKHAIFGYHSTEEIESPDLSVEKMKKEDIGAQHKRAYDIYKKLKNEGEIHDRTEDQYCMICVDDAILITNPIPSKFLRDLDSSSTLYVGDLPTRSTYSVKKKKKGSLGVSNETLRWI